MVNLKSTVAPARPKHLMPLGPSRRATPIHREARESMKRALRELETLRKEDPWVMAAVLDVALRRSAVGAYLSNRFVIQDVRERTHKLKAESVNASARGPATPPDAKSNLFEREARSELLDDCREARAPTGEPFDLEGRSLVSRQSREASEARVLQLVERVLGGLGALEMRGDSLDEWFYHCFLDDVRFDPDLARALVPIIVRRASAAQLAAMEETAAAELEVHAECARDRERHRTTIAAKVLRRPRRAKGGRS